MTWHARAALAACFFTALISHAAAAEAVRFPASTPWRGKVIELTASLFRPSANSKAPAVILMHGCGGLAGAVANSLTSHARYLAGNGFAALVLDSFGPRQLDGGTTCSDIPALTAALRYRVTDARDAARWLRGHKGVDGDNVFLMGQSNGGSVVINAARAGGFRAAAAYYPWCGTLTSGQPRSPLIVFGGERDNWTPPRRCQKHPAGPRYEYVHYPNAAHSFDVSSGLTSYLGFRVGYDSDATADSRRRMIRFFRKHLR